MLLSLPPDKLRRLARVNRDTADELDALADQVQAALDDGAELVDCVGAMSEPDLERLRRDVREADPALDFGCDEMQTRKP